MPALGNTGAATRVEHDRPLVSMEGFARFEQRARQRRMEKRVAAAQSAIHSRRFADARAALVELAELDPAHPELQALTLQLARAEQAGRPRLGAFAAAAAIFAAVILTASWAGKGRVPSVKTAAPAAVPETLLASHEIRFDLPAIVATTGEPNAALADAFVEASAVSAVTPATSAVVPVASADVVAEPAPLPVASPARPPDSPVVPTPAPPAPQLDLPTATAVEPSVVPPPVPQRVPSTPPPTAATATPPAAPPLDAAPAAAVVDDAAQVKAVLQKYQAAYERLDARLVHSVWPGVNQTMLARAFDGLESQTLTFKACDIQMRGVTASAVCTGSTRYVPKVGSREPRVEPLSWTFSLRKRPNDDWQIESARAER